jgi:transposase
MSRAAKSAPVVTGLIKEHRANGRNIYDGAARRELVRLCSEPGVSISKTALLNGINTNVLRRWIDENKRDPVWFNRRKSNDRASKSTAISESFTVKSAKAKPVPTVMLPIEMSKAVKPAAPPAVPSSVAPMIEVELAHGRVRLHGADATMLATVFSLLSAT